jgi:hypothetical protein
MEIDPGRRYQTMLTLWLALLMSVVMYFLVTLFVPPKNPDPANGSPGSLLIFGLAALGAFFVVASLAVKKKLLDRSVEQEDPTLVQKAMILACAMCEVSALLGLLEYLVIGIRRYYLLFLLAAVGIILHFPRPSQLEAASYKSRNILN